MKANNLRLGLILSYVSIIIHSLINIAYTPIVLSYLGANEYGLYSLSMSITGYLNILRFGFANSYLRYYSKYKVEEDNKKIAELNGLYLLVFSVIGLLSFIIGLVIVASVSSLFREGLTIDEVSKAKVLIFIIVINVSISFPLNIVQYFLTANEKFVFIRALGLIEGVISPCMAVCALALGFGSVGMTVIALIVTVVLKVIQIYYCVKKCSYKLTIKIKNFEMLKEIFIFSSYVFLNTIADQLSLNVDKFILGRYRGTADVAIFGIAMQIQTIYYAIANNITSVVSPRVNRLVLSKNKEGIDDLFIKVGRLQFIILSLIMSGFILIGRQFMFLWVGDEFADSFTIALLLMLPATFYQVQLLSVDVQRAMNMHKFRSAALFVIAIVKTGISIPLAQSFGGIGCAIGTAITTISGSIIIMSIYNQRKVGLCITQLYKNVAFFIPALIVPAVFGILINRYIDLHTITSFLLFGFLYVIVFAGSMWVISLNKYEKNLIIEPIKRIIKNH